MKKTKSKRIIITLTIVIAIVGIAYISAEKGLHFWLNKKLPTLLNQNPERKYDISYEQAKLHIRNRKLILNNIKISPSKPNNSTKNSVTVKQFNIEQLNLKHLFYENIIETKKLTLLEPYLKIYTKNDGTNQSKKQINEIWKDVFTRLSIANFEIIDAKLEVMLNDTTSPLFSFRDLDLIVSNFNIDTTTIKSPFPISFKKIEAVCKNINAKFDTISNLEIDILKLTNTEATIKRVKITPKISSEEFTKVKRAKNDWLDIYIDHVNLNDFNWDLENEKPNFYASSLYLDSTYIHALADQKYPKSNTGYKPLFSEMLRNLPFVFTLDSFVVKNSAVLFETIPLNQTNSSPIFFDKLYASGYNLHNTDEIQKRTELDIITNFMSETKIKASYKMNVNDANDRFQITGTMDDLSTTTINKILQPLAGVETVGEIYGLGFYIFGNNRHSTGTVNFEYDGLKIKVINTETNEKNRFLSTISNLALRKSNIISDKRFRQGSIDFDRELNKSFFSFIWESIKDGMMDTLIPFELRKEERKKNKKTFNIFKKR